MEPTEAKMSTPDAYKRLLSKSDRRSSAHNTPLQKVLIERMVRSHESFILLIFKFSANRPVLEEILHSPNPPSYSQSSKTTHSWMNKTKGHFIHASKTTVSCNCHVNDTFHYFLYTPLINWPNK